VAKGADPFDLLLLLLTPLEQVECLSGRFRWTRRWRRLGVVVVVHQAGAGVVKVVVVVVAVVVVVEEIVGRALDSFSPAQVGQEAPFILAPKLVIRIRDDGEEHGGGSLST